MEPSQVLLLHIRVDLEVMAIKGYYTLLRVWKLEPYHRMQFNVESQDIIVYKNQYYIGVFKPIQLCANYLY